MRIDPNIVGPADLSFERARPVITAALALGRHVAAAAEPTVESITFSLPAGSRVAATDRWRVTIQKVDPVADYWCAACGKVAPDADRFQQHVALHNQPPPKLDAPPASTGRGRGEEAAGPDSREVPPPSTAGGAK